MWFYLNKPTIFQKVLIDYELENTTGWLLFNLKPVKKENDLFLKETELGEAIGKHYYEAELRGKNCKSEYCEKENFVIYVAYPEDYAVRDPEYDKNNELNKNIHRKPVFKAYFQQFPTVFKYISKV